MDLPAIKAEFPEKLAPLFEPHPYKVLYGGRDGVKCLALGTRVVMADGSLRNVESVSVGEQVMGPDSQPRNVLAVSRGFGPMYSVKQSNGMEYRVNDAHILSLKKSRHTVDCTTMPSGNLRRPKGRYPNWPAVANVGVTVFAEQSVKWQYNFHGYKAGCLSLPSKALAIDPYFLGVWLGDGTGRELRITTADPEIEHFCRMMALSVGGVISLKRKAGQKAADIGFRVKVGRLNPLWEGFKAYGLRSNKHIPEDFLTTDEYSRLELLAGLIDTDGHYRGTERGYHIAQVNERLARDIKRLCDGLGFSTTLLRRKTQCGDVRGWAWNLAINGDVWRIPCKIPHKQAKQSASTKKDHLISRLKVERIADGDWAGFTIDGDHLFLLEDGTVTHNSWSIARALLIIGANPGILWPGRKEGVRILCGRETMDSIRESVHQLLSDQIALLGLHDFYKVLQSEIRGANGTEFVFAGLRKQSVSSLKSYEAIDIFWGEEASTVTRRSLTILLPTIRKTGSEIWWSLNPDLETDAVYQDFVVDPPPNSFTCKTSYRDNNWLSPESRQKIELLRERDPDTFHHVYEGGTRSTVEGAIYKAEIQAAEKAGRIRHVPYDTMQPVGTFWDLGYADRVSIWAAQRSPFEIKILRYFEGDHQAIDYYLQEMQTWGYIFGTCYLPWDGGTKSLGTGRSIEEIMRGKGFKTRVLRQMSIADGINATRTIFPQLYFDAKLCADGLQYLRRYQWGPTTALGVARREPLHDDASHPADALRTLAVGIKEPERKKEQTAQPRRITSAWG